MRIEKKKKKPGRPLKRGLDWYIWPCERSEPEKKMLYDCGKDTMYVYIHLLDKIFSQRGFYMEYSKDIIDIFAYETCLGGDPKKYRKFIDDVISSGCEHGVFSMEKLDVYSVLTGADIQRNYFTVARRRTLNLTDLEMQYLLILGELQVISVTDGAKFEVERGYGE